ncbi:MAG: DNA polymerase III subunit delta [Ignavibacteriae bacterium]|nr:DNA polymerase III subunit delta [Ignavibacteriota bacterium]
MASTKIEGIPVAELERLLKKQQFSSLYLVFGEEDFLAAEAMQLLIKHAVDEATSGFNLDVLYGSDVEARQVLAVASSYPMMAERRVVIVREFEKVNNKESLVSYFEKPSPSTCLMLMTTKPDFRQKVFSTLKTNAILVEGKSPYDNQMPDWIQTRVKKLGKNISLEASQLLHARTGNALRVVQSEIDKLFIYVGEKKEIALDDVEEVVGMSKQYNIFELQKMLGKLQSERTHEIMERMLDSGESAIYMVTQVTKYLQKLWLYHEYKAQKLNDATIAGKFRINPYFLDEYAQAARNFPPHEIEFCFRHLLEADEALKFSADEKLTMTVLLYKMLNRVKTLEYEAV